MSAAAFADPISAIGFEGYTAGHALASASADILDDGTAGDIRFFYESSSGSVDASAGESELPLSTKINGTLKVRHAADLDGSWTEEIFAPVFTDGKAKITVTAEDARFMRAVFTK